MNRFIGHNYPGHKNITDTEAGVLLDNINKKFDNVLVVGTWMGWVPAILSQISKQVTTIDIERNVFPKPEHIIHKMMKVPNVSFIVVEDIISAIKPIANKYDLIFIDECHDRMSDLLRALNQYCEDGTDIVIHDVLGEDKKGFTTPSAFENIKSQKGTVVTYDSDNNKTGFGLLTVIKEDKAKKPKQQKNKAE